MDEEQGSTSSKLLAPQASVTSAASAETTAKYGITHWKIFRGKQNMVMTGYDGDGHAVKGVNIGFAQSSDGNARLLTQIDDGSSFTGVHDFASGQNLAPQALTPDSQEFITALAGDATTIHQQFDERCKTKPSNESQCGSDMASVLTAALQCMGGSTSAAAQAACVTAAQKASSSSSSCQYTGATSTGSTSTPTTSTGSNGSTAPTSTSSGTAPSTGSVLGSLPSYTGGSPFDVGQLESTIGSVVGALGSLSASNPYASGGSCNISSPFGGGLANILGSLTNGDCSFATGDGSPFGAFNEGDLCSFGGFGGGGGGGY